MSLINKMLKDLESRQDGSDTRSPQAVYEDLRAARGDGRSTGRSLPAGPVILIGLVLVLGGVLGWFFLGRSGMPPTPVVATPPAVVAVETPASPPESASGPSLARGPRLDPIGEAASGPSLARGPRLDPIGVVEAPARSTPPPSVRPPAREKPLMAMPPAMPAAKPAPARPVAQPKPPVTPLNSAPVTAAAPVARPGQMEKVVKPPEAGEVADAAYREAAALMQQGRMDEAEAKLRAVLVQSPGHAASRELLVGVLLQRGARDDARQQLEAGIAQSPGHPVFYSLLARLYVDAGQEARALALLESATARAVNDVEHQRFLAALYQRANRHADAVKTYRQVVTLRPYDGRGWLGLGISLEAMEQWKDAATAYQRALAGQGLDDRLSEYVRQRQAFVKSK